MMDATRCEGYLASVRDWARSTGRAAQLEEQLGFLATYACHGDTTKTRCRLLKDFAQFSFQFDMEARNATGEYQYWFNGGLIFHPSDGTWSIHT